MKAPGLPGVVLLASAIALACGGPREAPRTTPAGVGHVETGAASWYGSRYHGRKTASGERYDMYAMTAAHRTLPFGTVVDVTNLQNGRTVRVRINDRGPFVEDRVIDLSYRAAKKIGMVRDGVVRVELRVVRR